MNRFIITTICIFLIFSSNSFSNQKSYFSNLKHKYSIKKFNIGKSTRSNNSVWGIDNWLVLGDVDGWIYDDLLDFYIYQYNTDPDYSFFGTSFDGYKQVIMQNVDFYEMVDDEGNGYSLSYIEGKPDVYKTKDSLEVVDYDYKENGLVDKITYTEKGNSWTNIYYITFNYDSEDKVIAINNYSDDLENGSYLNLGRDTLVYNNDGTLKEVLTQVRDDGSSGWNINAKDVYEYLGDTVITSSYIESWETPGQMELEYRKWELFDSMKRMIAYWEYSFLSETDSSFSEMYEYNYSQDNDTVEILYYEEDSSSPDGIKVASKTIDVYNEFSQLDFELSYNATLSGEWENPIKMDYFYNSNNRLESCLFYDWDSQLSDFITTDSTSFIYDDLGFPDSVKAFVYDKYLEQYELISFDDFNFPKSNAISDYANIRLKNIGKLTVKKSLSEISFILNNSINEMAKIYDLQGKLISEVKPFHDSKGISYKLNTKNISKGKMLIFSINSKDGYIRETFLLN